MFVKDDQRKNDEIHLSHSFKAFSREVRVGELAQKFTILQS